MSMLKKIHSGCSAGDMKKQENNNEIHRSLRDYTKITLINLSLRAFGTQSIWVHLLGNLMHPSESDAKILQINGKDILIPSLKVKGTQWNQQQCNFYTQCC